MNCHHCNSSNEHEAIFCSYCGQQLRQENEMPAEPQVIPALGSTIDLRRFNQPEPPARPQPAARPMPRPVPARPQPAARPVPLPVPALTLPAASIPQTAGSSKRHHTRRGRPRGWGWNALIGIGFLLLVTGANIAEIIVPLLLAGLGWAIYQGHFLNIRPSLTWIAGLAIFMVVGVVIIKTLFLLGITILPAIVFIWLGLKLVS